MGKASKWFRSVLGLKKSDQQEPAATRAKEKRRWSFVKSYREKDQSLNQLHNHRAAAAAPNGRSSAIPSQQFEEDPDRHAIAVAAARADVAEKAVAAANAAAEAVRMMSSGRCGGGGGGNSVTAYGGGSRGWREDVAAVRIQSAFRGYLARRALRALKSLVRLQALVRGHIQRKRMAKQAQWMQALLRVQARARAGRAQFSVSPQSSSKSSHFHHPGPPTPEKFEHAIRARSGKYEQLPILKRTGSKSNLREMSDEERTHASFNWSERPNEKPWEQRAPSARTCSIDDEKSDKILEVDTVKPHFTPKQRKLFSFSMHGLASDHCSYSFTTSKDSITHQSVRSLSSGEVQSVTPLKFSRKDREVQSVTPLKFSRDVHEEEAYRTAENSPQFYSASSKGASGRSPFAPSKSDGSASFLSGYSDYCPNYMSYTESSKAKLRSLSAPKQRPQYERSSSTKRHSMNGLEPRSSSAQRASTLRASFTSKAYPGSGRLDRLGMPIGQRY